MPETIQAPTRDTLKKCLLCEETRGIQKCHIIGRKVDRLLKSFWMNNVSVYEQNFLHLCPTHHWCFDHNLLNNEEFAKIKDKIIISVVSFINVFGKWYGSLSKNPESLKFAKSYKKVVFHVIRTPTLVNRIFKERQDISYFVETLKDEQIDYSTKEGV